MTQTLSVLIKAYNEGHRIDRAIASVMAARHEVEPLELEIVVADARSQDRTAERAVQWCRNAPVRVVQLQDPGDRGCGSGVELGYQASRGEWLLLMDGDMTLQPGFLQAARAHLLSHPTVAGVGGLIRDEALRNGVDGIRSRNALGRRTGERPWLEGGGLYRRQAIIEAGDYAGDARLAAFEEADLGLRLARAGWTLERLPIDAMRHDGHAQGTVSLLIARWRSGRATAAGRLLRLHLGRPGAGRAARLLLHPLALGAAWLLGAATLAAVWLTGSSDDAAIVTASGLGVLVGATGVQALRKRSLQHVVTAWLDWHLMLVGIVVGGLGPMPRRVHPLPAKWLTP